MKAGPSLYVCFLTPASISVLCSPSRAEATPTTFASPLPFNNLVSPGRTTSHTFVTTQAFGERHLKSVVIVSRSRSLARQHSALSPRLVNHRQDTPRKADQPGLHCRGSSYNRYRKNSHLRTSLQFLTRWQLGYVVMVQLCCSKLGGRKRWIRRCATHFG